MESPNHKHFMAYKRKYFNSNVRNIHTSTSPVKYAPRQTHIFACVRDYLKFWFVPVKVSCNCIGNYALGWFARFVTIDFLKYRMKKKSHLLSFNSSRSFLTRGKHLLSFFLLKMIDFLLNLFISVTFFKIFIPFIFRCLFLSVCFPFSECL